MAVMSVPEETEEMETEEPDLAPGVPPVALARLPQELLERPVVAGAAAALAQEVLMVPEGKGVVTPLLIQVMEQAAAVVVAVRISP